MKTVMLDWCDDVGFLVILNIIVYAGKHWIVYFRNLYRVPESEQQKEELLGALMSA